EVCPAGLGGGYLAAPEVVELVGMFVRPQARGRGVGEAVIDAVAGWATQQGASTVHLWVTETNKGARLLYERCGFTVTAERQPLPSNPALGEIGMQRPVESGPVEAGRPEPDLLSRAPFSNWARTPSSRTGRRPVNRLSASAAARAITAAS